MASVLHLQSYFEVLAVVAVALLAVSVAAGAVPAVGALPVVEVVPVAVALLVASAGVAVGNSEAGCC